jgi:hypothetical protein
MTKVAGSGSGSISLRYEFADPDPDKNLMDQEHWVPQYKEQIKKNIEFRRKSTKKSLFGLIIRLVAIKKVQYRKKSLLWIRIRLDGFIFIWFLIRIHIGKSRMLIGIWIQKQRN